MKYCFVLLLWTFILTPPCFTHRAVVAVASTPQAPTKLSSRCLDDEQISTRLEAISAGRSLDEQLDAKKQLIKDANKSPECRKVVITALVKAMNQPALDLANDRPNFYLWHYGGEILASLKAEETLDFLIAHLDLHDGTFFPLNHHPALVNITRMGSLAIPKLAAVLQQSPDPNARQYAVFCLGEIGGPDAKIALQQAVGSESNACVSTFIRAALQAFDKSSSGYQVAPDDRTKWYGTFLCD